MPGSRLFLCQDAILRRQVEAVSRRLPPFTGLPLRIEAAPGLRDRKGPVHAGSFLRQRRIAFDCTRPEFPRIFVHELFHFVWFRAGNPVRHAFEELVKDEWRAASRGELGWSAEWRKGELTQQDVARRSRRWREYCCESFCDTAAWLYSGMPVHEEFTLPGRFRRMRAAWFHRVLEVKGISI